jgi:hypothetical protein
MGMHGWDENGFVDLSQEKMNVAKFTVHLCCLEVRIFKFYLHYS